jgi:DNA-binding Xre family transcriptional regulator
MRPAEPTKVCVRCQERKPYSEFYPRQPRNGVTYHESRCKPCTIAHAFDWQRRNRDRKREYDRRRREKIKADPELAAVARAQKRESKRRTLGIRPENYRVSRLMREADAGPATKVPSDAFSTFLRSLDMPAADLHARSGVDDAAISRLAKGRQPFVSIDTVDRVCLAVGARIEDIYGE